VPISTLGFLNKIEIEITNLDKLIRVEYNLFEVNYYLCHMLRSDDGFRTYYVD